MQIRQNPEHETEVGAATCVSRLSRDRGRTGTGAEQGQGQKQGQGQDRSKHRSRNRDRGKNERPKRDSRRKESRQYKKRPASIAGLNAISGNVLEFPCEGRSAEDGCV